MKLHQRLLMKLGSISYGRARVFHRKAGMKIGEKVQISSGLYVDRPEGVIIGDNCFINHFVHFHNGADPEATITIGNNVLVLVGKIGPIFLVVQTIGQHYCYSSVIRDRKDDSDDIYRSSDRTSGTYFLPD